MDQSHQKCACTNRPMKPQAFLGMDEGSCGWCGMEHSIFINNGMDKTCRTRKLEEQAQSDTDSFGKCGMMPGMNYVPWQRWGRTYPLAQAISRGTIFPDLDYPFEMGRCR